MAARRLTTVLGLAVAAATLALPSAAGASRLIKHVGWGPISDRAAAAMVHRSKWEPRPQNRRYNHAVPTPTELAYMRQHEDPNNDPYYRHVDGQYTGTTDEIIQWAAYKWGIAPNVLRAVATVESWWKQKFVGNDGTAFGLFQVRIPYHCCLPEIRDSSAYNADYYASVIRAYYDGKMRWLYGNPENGHPYRKGELWGSVGAWVSGRWKIPVNQHYVHVIKKWMHERVWRTDPYF